MKYFLYTFLFVMISCSVPSKKSETKTEIETETIEEKIPEPVIEKEEIIEKIKHQLIVVLKNPNSINDVKSLVQNSGLTWNKTAYDTDVTKIGVIEVPVEKIDFWKNKLQESNEFSTIEKHSNETLTALINKEKNVLLRIQKTPCFGDCAVYTLSIDKKGNVIYNGNQYVLEKGIREFTLTDTQLENITKTLAKKDFSEFKKVYDNPEISDLASTFIAHNGKQIEIRLWNNIPDELIEVHEYVEGILLDKKFFE